MEVPYGSALSLLAARSPDAPALVCDGRLHTREAIERAANRLARAYARLGVEPGDLVSLTLPNGAEAVVAAHAVWKLGAVPQPMSWHLPAAERDAILELARPALVVGIAEPPAGVPSVPPGFEPPEHLSDERLPDRLPPHRQVITSGGSTGRPKLIVDLVPARIDPDQPAYTVAPGTRTLIPGPMYHAGPFLNCHWTLLVGGLVVVMPTFDAVETLRLIEEHRIQFVQLVPTMMRRIWRLGAATRGRYDLSSLERVVTSAASCPTPLMRDWIEWLGPDRMFEAYGASERLGGTMISGREWLHHPGSVGRPTDGREIRVLDADGRDAPPNEVGELYMMPPGGQGSTYRYIGSPPLRATSDGWETLGDMGYLDEAGYVYLVDRRSDLIVSGGANVYPAEVEAAIESHPGVHSCAVIGLPDDDLGSRVHAVVHADGRLDADELRAHVRGVIDRYKVPRTFELVDQPVRDDAGKVRRARLRQERIDAGASD